MFMQMMQTLNMHVPQASSSEKTVNGVAGRTRYLAIRDALLGELATSCTLGSVLPSEVQLAKRFNVNRHTVGRALHELVELGYLERKRGLGSLVIALPSECRPDGKRFPYCISEQTRFSEMLGTQGRKTRVMVTARRREPADEEAARWLQIPKGADVIVLDTLRLVDNIPFCRITHLLADAQVPGLLENYRGNSLHRFLELTYGWHLKRVVSVASADLPNLEDAKALAIPRNRPVLKVRSVNRRDIDALPIECSLTRFRSDRMELVVSF